MLTLKLLKYTDLLNYPGFLPHTYMATKSMFTKLGKKDNYNEIKKPNTSEMSPLKSHTFWVTL